MQALPREKLFTPPCSESYRKNPRHSAFLENPARLLQILDSKKSRAIFDPIKTFVRASRNSGLAGPVQRSKAKATTGARNGCTSGDRKLSASSRICADSIRFSTRLNNCSSFGQSRLSQSRKIGKIDKQTRSRLPRANLIGASKPGSARAKNQYKKYPQRACQ